jgi:hypothetical protein
MPEFVESRPAPYGTRHSPSRIGEDLLKNIQLCGPNEEYVPYRVAKSLEEADLHELVKPLIGIQRVEVPLGESLAGAAKSQLQKQS